MNVVVTVILVLWLAALTAAVVGLYRHVAAYEASQPADATAAMIDLDADGLDVPAALPDKWREIIGGLGLESAQHLRYTAGSFAILAFSAGCGSCLEKTAEMIRLGILPEGTLILIAGSRDRAKQDLLDLLQGQPVMTVSDPQAHDAMKLLDLSSVPYSFRVVDGVIREKAYVREATDVRYLGGASSVGVET